MGLDDRQTFEKVRDHLLAQKVRAYGEEDPRTPHSNGCLYRDPATGRRCAIGCLIDDANYSVAIEGAAIVSDPDHYCGPSTAWDQADKDKVRMLCAAVRGSGIDASWALLDRLQRIHDGPEDLWGQKLDSVRRDLDHAAELTA
jgi:hypothetical protein